MTGLARRPLPEKTRHLPPSMSELTGEPVKEIPYCSMHPEQPKSNLPTSVFSFEIRILENNPLCFPGLPRSFGKACSTALVRCCVPTCTKRPLPIAASLTFLASSNWLRWISGFSHIDVLAGFAPGATRGWPGRGRDAEQTPWGVRPDRAPKLLIIRDESHAGRVRREDAPASSSAGA